MCDIAFNAIKKKLNSSFHTERSNVILLLQHLFDYPRIVSCVVLVMPPTSEKLEGHIASRAFARPFVTLFDA